MKIIKTSSTIDNWTRLEFLLGLKLSGQTDILIEASNLMDELYKGVNYITNDNIEMILIIKTLYEGVNTFCVFDTLNESFK